MLGLWWLVALLGARDQTSANYNIYRAVARWVNATGDIPRPGQILDRGVDGMYADFTAPNLLVYRLVFAPDSLVLQKALFLTWQAALFALCVWLLARHYHRFALTHRQGQLAALLVASPFVSGLTLAYLDDKAGLLAFPLLALAVTARWWRAVITGVAAGWSGALALAMPLLAVRRSASGARRGLDVVAVTCGATAFALATLLAGTHSAALLRNRAAREGLDPFALSVWRLFGENYTGTLRLALLAACAGVIGYGVWRSRVTTVEAVAALVLLFLLTSTNTVPTRLVAVVVLGVLVFRTARARGWYLAATFTWLFAVTAATLAHRFVGTDVLTDRPVGDLAVAPEVLATNMLLLAAVGAPMWRVIARRSTGGYRRLIGS